VMPAAIMSGICRQDTQHVDSSDKKSTSAMCKVKLQTIALMSSHVVVTDTPEPLFDIWHDLDAP
jgi:hypothetical protein